MRAPGLLIAVRANGEEFPIEATISHMRVSGERTYMVILRDITDRKRAAEAMILSEKQASVGRLAATIAHEINNPLAAVTNAVFLAKTADNLPALTIEHLEVADSELKRVAQITHQLLGFYRENQSPTVTSVTDVLSSAVGLLENKIKAKRARIEKQWDRDVQITAMASELRQVFCNLLANSLDAIGDQGTIRLRVSEVSPVLYGRRYVRATVADNGTGISADARQRIFQPFFTTKGAVGTGLGLWVSKQIINKHGGTIRVRSKVSGHGRGTVFSVILPIDAATTSRESLLA